MERSSSFRSSCSHTSSLSQSHLQKFRLSTKSKSEGQDGGDDYGVADEHPSSGLASAGKMEEDTNGDDQRSRQQRLYLCPSPQRRHIVMQCGDVPPARPMLSSVAHSEASHESLFAEVMSLRRELDAKIQRIKELEAVVVQQAISSRQQQGNQQPLVLQAAAPAAAAPSVVRLDMGALQQLLLASSAGGGGTLQQPQQQQQQIYYYQQM